MLVQVDTLINQWADRPRGKSPWNRTFQLLLKPQSVSDAEMGTLEGVALGEDKHLICATTGISEERLKVIQDEVEQLLY